MKQLLTPAAFILLLLTTNKIFAQTNTFPASGNVGIGTLTPLGLLDVRADAYINGVRVGIGANGNTECTVLGKNALGNVSASFGYDNTAIGANTLSQNAGGSANTALGTWTLNSNTIGLNNTAIGNEALRFNISGYSNVALGVSALRACNAGAGNTAVGDRAMTNFETGNSNTAIGISSMGAFRNGTENVAVGAASLYSQYGTGSYNVAIGNNAMSNASTASNNTAIGHQSLFKIWNGYNNTATGYRSLYNNNDGVYNTADGYLAMYQTSTGSYNAASGGYSLYNTSTGSYNTGMGYGALYYNTTGTTNTGLGYFASPSTGALTNTTALGILATTTASNQVRIGNISVTSIGGYVNWTNISDGRIKINVQDNVRGLEFINRLKPVTYNLDLDAAEKLTGVNHKLLDKDEKNDILQLHKKAKHAKEQISYSGFIAQEVEQAASESKYEFSGVDAPKNDNDLYGLRYAEFVVPLVKAVQELSQQNEAMKKEIETLKAKLDAKEEKADIRQVNFTGALLKQNVPNPFKGSTSIGYTLPEKCTSAQIVISNSQGSKLRQVAVTGSKGQININTNDLSAGIYQYSLYVNGNMAATKQMIVSK